ncbi:MAG: hypothetical protein HGA67_01710 [Candidatus Yonathbacteria bacterium]|nr:hypothetical protein [Candidatus Yonathbacteria bacterium]
MKSIPNRHAGYMVMLVVVFTSVFVTLMFGLTGFVMIQKKATVQKEYAEQSLQIAEAGLDYYQWYLAHNPDDLTDGTGEEGPYAHTYTDPESALTGTFSLDVSGNMECGSVSSISIRSTGYTDAAPGVERVVYGRYARPSVAEYAYIINDNVWAGNDRVIVGRYHANGGIRMDGTNQSLVTSGVATWQCTSSFGCSPTQTKPGVFGSGSGSSLWQYPAETVDFVGLNLNLATVKTKAQNGGGLYFPERWGSSTTLGYHVIFNANETMTVYRVSGTTSINSYTEDDGWESRPEQVRTQSLIGTYAIPSACGLVFFENNLWVEGTVSGKVTVVAANTVRANVDADAYIVNNINYAHTDGSDGLTLVAENNALIPYNVPFNMDIRGVIIAQNGRFGRNHYDSGSQDTRGTLTVNGSIVSNKRVGTKWTSGSTFISGFAQRYDSYDRKLATEPPPLTPNFDDEYKFVEWREMEQ